MGITKSLLFVVIITLAACNARTSKNKTPETTAPPAAPAEAVTVPASKAALPTMMLQDAAGQAIDIQQFKGKKLFVNLWATWCPPCRAEMPGIEKLYRASDKANTQFVMISLDKNFDLAKQYVKDKSMTMPIFYPAADLPEIFAVEGIPATFIFDENGALVQRIDGSDNYDTPEFHSLFGAAK